MDDEQQMIAQMSRQLIAVVAPAELPMFRANSAAFFVNPQQALKPGKPKDEMLGFGLGGATSFVTPVVMAVVALAWNLAAAELKKAFQGESQEMVTSWVKALFSPLKHAQATDAAKPPTPSPAPARQRLTQDQLQRLHAAALEKARQYVDADQARRLADELVGHLATA